MEDNQFVEKFPNGGSVQEEKFEEKLPYGQGYVEKDVYQQNNGYYGWKKIDIFVNQQTNQSVWGCFFVFLNIYHFGCNKIGLINGHVVSADFN